MPPFSRGCLLFRPPQWSRGASQAASTIRARSSQVKTKIEVDNPSRRKGIRWREYVKLPLSIRAIDAILGGFRSGHSRIVGRIPQAWRYYIGNVLVFGPIVGMALLHCPYTLLNVNGPSMSPLFNPNNSPDLPETKDRILVEYVSHGGRSTTAFWRDWLSGDKKRDSLPLRRGEIVVFYTPHDPERIAVKRIVGIPGDRVQPLPGYEGGIGPVIVPYNHIWVEGDVDDRNKSKDSNWYGPISQQLVIGRVIAVMAPWYAPRFLEQHQHDYPASKKRRVQEGVVLDAMVDYEQNEATNAFLNGDAAHSLQQLRSNRRAALNMLKSDEGKWKVMELYTQVSTEAQRDDPSTKALAEEYLDELHGLFAASETRSRQKQGDQDQESEDMGGRRRQGQSARDWMMAIEAARQEETTPEQRARMQWREEHRRQRQQRIQEQR